MHAQPLKRAREIMGPKHAEGVANCVEQSDLCLHCLPRRVYPKTRNHYIFEPSHEIMALFVLRTLIL